MPEFAPKRPDQLDATFVTPTGYFVPVSPTGGPTGKTNISDMVRSMDLNGSVSLSAGNNNDLAVSDWKFIALNNSTGGQVTVTGMNSAAQYAYKVVYVTNNGPDDVLLSTDNAGSSAANRFRSSDDLLLRQYDTAVLVYNGVWYITGCGICQEQPTTTSSTTETSTSSTTETSTSTSTSTTTAGAFQPDDIAGLVQWFDFSSANNVKQNDDGTGTVTNGDSVGFADDLSSGNNNVIQATAGNKGVWNSNVQNSLGAVTFDSDDSLSNTNLSAGFGEFTIAFTGKTTDTNTHQFLDYRDSVDPFGNCDLIAVVGDSGLFSYRYRGPNCNMREITESNDTNWHYWTLTYNASNWVVRRDGVQVSSISASSTSAIDYSIIGGSNVIIGEIVVYNSALGTTDRDDVESYLSDKWGL